MRHATLGDARWAVANGAVGDRFPIGQPVACATAQPFAQHQRLHGVCPAQDSFA
ncbi:MAG: hypothetical protein RMK45_03580 [Armatimonadota bacterium]|nr:hypothetical protein [Armatimonadota bacterium]